MSKEYNNKEEPYDLLKSAQDDIIHICDTVESKRFDPEKRVGRICRFAAESVEKMLKSWIINNNDKINVFGIHDLQKLNNIATDADSKFSVLRDRLINLNNYTPKFRYNSRFIIEKHEVKECLNNLKIVYDFPLIKDLRNKINMENNFNELPDNINILFGEYKQNAIKNSDSDDNENRVGMSVKDNKNERDEAEVKRRYEEHQKKIKGKNVKSENGKKKKSGR